MHRPVRGNREMLTAEIQYIDIKKKYTHMYMYIPHIPSLTLEEGIFKGLKPAFVQ